MSDFLSSLTTRSFKPSEDIRPRLPSRFETAVMSSEAQPIEPLEQDEWVTHSPQTQRPQPASPAPSRNDEPPRSEAAPRPTTQPAQPGDIRPQVEPPSERLPIAEPVRPAPVVHLAETALIPSPSPSGRREQPEGRWAKFSASQREDDDKVPLFNAPHPEKKGSKQGQPSEVPRPEGEGFRVRASQTPPEQRPTTPTITPRLSPDAESASESPIPLLKPAAPETVVHVSIGRVEVRLNTAKAAAPQRQPVPARAPLRPAVSLNDYLKRREGGKS